MPPEKRFLISRRAVLLGLGMGLLSSVTWGAPVYVDTNGAGGGTSWADAASLSNALTIAQAGDELWLAQGVYTNNSDGKTSFKVTNNLTLYGGFTNGMASRGERNWTNYATILDGQYSRRVVDIVATNVTLDGILMRNGMSAGAGEHGSGIRKTSAGSLTLANCWIQDNRTGASSQNGCGACFGSGAVVMTNCTVTGNKSDNYFNSGLGVYASGASLVVIDCVFSNNTTFQLRHSTSGGGIYFGNGSLAVTNSLFVANEQHSWGGWGGAAVYLASAASATFSHCIFRTNAYSFTGSQNGGTLFINVGGSTTVTVENCTLANNTPGQQGGAFYVQSGNLVVRNSILWTNSAVTGKEIYNPGGNVTLDYVCITGTGDDYIYGPKSVTHCMTNNPLFASLTDLHLKSAYGRWDPATAGWTNDTGVFSPCIDAGDPASDYSKEPGNNGGRINLGRYGNKAEASKSPTAVAPGVTNQGASVYYTTARLSGELLAGTRSAIMIYYGTNADALANSVDIYPPQDAGAVFSAQALGLDADRTYYYACYATNAAGTNWASVSSFSSGSAPPGGGPGIIHVDKNATGAENGKNWVDAYRTIIRGMAAVNAGTSEVWIASGEYVEGAEVAIATNVSIYGGFPTGAGTNRADRSVTNPVLVAGANNHRVVNITAGNVILDGLTLTGGYLPTGYGAGLWKTGAGLLALANCRIMNNISGGEGSGTSFDAGSVTLTNCTIAGNQSASGYNINGIGIRSTGVSLQIVDCVFSNNVKTGNPYPTRGGGIYFESGALSVRNSTFVGNQSCSDRAVVGGGAAAYLGSAASATFRNCIFRNNTYNTSAYYGGTIYVAVGSSKTVTVENCTFATNMLGQYGGAFYVASGNLGVKNSILWGNTATTGKEIYLLTGSVTVDHSILTATGTGYVDGAAVSLLSVSTNDPQFAGATDLHLKSTAGRWDPATGSWTNDAVTSYAIDEGDPSSDFSLEPSPNGARINLGRYGNTAEASKSPTATAPTVENVEPPDIEYTSAILKGQMTAGTRADVRISYGTNSAALDNTVLFYPRRESGDVFSNRVTGLISNTLYYYQCYATNMAGTSLASLANFTSGSKPPGGPDTVIHVNKNAYGANTGRNWVDAFTSVQSSIDAAAGTTNEIWIAAGVYVKGSQLDITNTLSLYGGFAGTETTRAQRNITNNPVSISGNNAYRVVNITAGDVILDGLTLTGGYLTTGYGAGLWKTGSGSLTLANCRLVTNYLTSSGGGGSGTSFDAGSVTLTNCTIAGNQSADGYDLSGIGIRSTGVSLQIVDCVFSNNVKTGNPYPTRGGGIYFDNGSLSVLNSTFIGNEQSSDRDPPNGGGAAVYLGSAASATFGNCVFRNNRYNSSSLSGGTIYMVVGSSKTVTVVNCTFATNTPGRYGGAFYVASGNLNVKNSILWTNAASVAGTEIYATNAASIVTVAYSDITGTNSPFVVTVSGASVSWGAGILTNDPLFASATDLHLKSRGGRWDPGAGAWTNDAVHSPCIDAGDPASDYANEPDFNGHRINLGAYGNTWQASKTLQRGTVFVVR